MATYGPDPPARRPDGWADDALVGREREMAELLAALERALDGRGRLVLLGGDPGIGKSRLAGELAGVARARGATILWGRCWEAGGARAYWPWVQAIRTYLLDQDEAALVQQLGAGAPDVAQIVPELHALLPGLTPAPAEQHAEPARFRLFDAVTSFLVRAGRAQPIVLLLDDLQAADVPSLLLLPFLVNELEQTSILVLGTYRDTDIDLDHPLTQTLAELARYPTTRRLHLRGLDRTDVPLGPRTGVRARASGAPERAASGRAGPGARRGGDGAGGGRGARPARSAPVRPRAHPGHALRRAAAVASHPTARQRRRGARAAVRHGRRQTPGRARAPLLPGGVVRVRPRVEVEGMGVLRSGRCGHGVVWSPQRRAFGSNGVPSM